MKNLYTIIVVVAIAMLNVKLINNYSNRKKNGKHIDHNRICSKNRVMWSIITFCIIFSICMYCPVVDPEICPGVGGGER